MTHAHPHATEADSTPPGHTWRRPAARTLAARVPALAHCALALCALTLTGCVERRIRVTSEPAGAIVWLNDVEIGRTPTETNFKFYGIYDVRLELEGHEPLVTTADASTPWWDFPGPDLIAEAIPGSKRIIDWHFVLERKLDQTVSRDELEAGMFERARTLRDQLGPAPAPQPAPESGPGSVGTPTSGDTGELAPNGSVPNNDSAGADD